jgi:DNA replication protein
MIDMKNSKLIDIFKDGNIVIPIYLLKHYKDLKLEFNEFIFMMYLYNLGNNILFDPKKIAEDINIDLSSTMNYIGILTDKGFIKVDVLKNEKGLMEEYLILDDFFNKISLMTIDEINKSSSSECSDIFDVIQKEFGRTLSTMEIEIIKAWLENNISEDLIKEALKEAIFNGVSNLRYIDKILYEWGKSNITDVKGVEALRKKRNIKQEHDSEIDIDIVDWNWFDEDE